MLTSNMSNTAPIRQHNDTVPCDEGFIYDSSSDEERHECNDAASLSSLLTPSEPSKSLEHAAIVYDRYSDDAGDVLEIRQYFHMPRPRAAKEVVIRVEASTVSFTDTLIRRNNWYKSVSLPITPGFDVVGTIVSVGEKVRQRKLFQVGDRVAALIKRGGNACYANVHYDKLVKVPGGVDAAEAACVTHIYTSAYQALRCARNSLTLAGAKVLVTGGNGPIGEAIVELSKKAGAEAVYATAHERYHPHLKSLGAICLPFECTEWLPKVKGQMDVVIDSICQDDYISPQAALNNDGRLVCTGMTAIVSGDAPASSSFLGTSATAMWTSLKSSYLMKQTCSYDVWSSFKAKPDDFKRDLEYLLQLLRKHEIQPNVQERIGLEEVANAHYRLERGQEKGCIVCTPWKKILR
mmetsp:Transcript_34125/g.50966  ORF Transcript_34125/g.50966 Transcript_34125/m.50966 type:complete len:407 (-) Transcript_34125:714-1934(-)